jgi:hypothetical protein
LTRPRGVLQAAPRRVRGAKIVTPEPRFSTCIRTKIKIPRRIFHDNVRDALLAAEKEGIRKATVAKEKE